MAKRVLLAALTSALSGASARVQLLPAGTFTSNDGRPGNLEGVTAKAWILDQAAADALVAKVNARATPLAIDYEHQTFNAEFNGQPAPAAGWFTTVEFVPGEGLFAVDVQWTEKAKAWIAEHAYRFISPVFGFDKNTGVVVDLKPVALTNNPGLDMQAVALSSRFNPDDEESFMNPILKAMLAALGLTEAATEAEAVAKIDGLKTAAAETVALKAQVVDPAQYVPAAVHTELTARLTAATTELTALKAKDTGAEVEALLTAGIAEAKLLGDASVAWARETFKTDPAGLKKYLDAMPAIAALKGNQTAGKTPSGAGPGVVALTAEQKGIAKRMGVTEAAYLKTLQDEAAATAAA